MATTEVIIHDLESAAARAKVTPDVVRRWITEGLRATPVGSVGRRGPRDYRIFDSWLVEFLERRSGYQLQATQPTAGDPETTPPSEPVRVRGSRRRPVPPDGLWPKPKAED
jgi:hypothetical protein